MTAYVISYDLLKEKEGTHDYQDLYDALDELETHKILYSVRLISTTMSGSQLKAYLKQHMDDNDRIWVSRVRKDEHWYTAIAGTNAWLQAHLPT